MKKRPLTNVPRLDELIREVRGQKVMLDFDLVLVMFQLTAEENASLRSQFATLKPGRGRHRKYRPYAFTCFNQQRKRKV